MKILKTLLFLLLLSIKSFCQDIDKTATEKDYYTEIAYEFINEKIIIPVEIEGEQYRFLFDTGAPNFITNNLYNRIKTNFIKPILVSDASNKKDSLRIVAIPQVSIGDVPFKNTSAIVTNKHSNFLFDCFKIDGIIGSNLVQRSIVQILPITQTLILTDQKDKLSLDKKNSTKLKLYFYEKKPFIEIQLKGKQKGKDQVLLDTGMKGLYSLSNRNLKVFEKRDIMIKKQTSEGIMGTGFLGAEKRTKYHRIVIPEIKINNTSFKNVTVETTNSLNSRVGNELLKYGTITIDFKNGKFYYNSFKKIVDIPVKNHGFNATLIDHKLVVGIIWDENLKSKMNFGDEILEVNGVDTRKIDRCDLITKRSMFGSQEKLTLTILKNNGETEKIVTEKK